MIATLLTATGVALRLAPLSRPAVPPPSALSTRPNDREVRVATRAPAPSRASDDPIVGADIFSPARVAPPRLSALANAPTPRHPPAALARGPSFTLYGTTIGPRGAVALITAGGDPAQVHAMGDVIAGARLVAITESTVTLLRPSGPLVLHVPPAAPVSP